ncbi:MAG: serine/threonine-protein kinase [Blautia sp.]|nr:serine/threonine-protein kinase [Blautia sp.]
MNLQGTYTDIVEIGSGGGGTVFRAFHVRMEKYVVLKKIHDNIKDNVDIQGELNILKNLRHEYLPTVLDFIQDEGSVYTVMDYIPGESFENLLNRGIRFTQAQVKKYAEQLGKVLAYLHGKTPSIVHGDIKPANLMLTPEDNICLIDFNISQLQNGVLNRNMGYTPGYASPEQVRIVLMLQQYYAGMASSQNVNAGSGTVLLGADGAPVQNAAAGSGTVLLGADGVPVQNVSAGSGTVLLGADGAPVQNAAAGSGTVLLGAESVPVQPGQQWVMPALSEKMDVRSDIYSAGATLYAIFSGTIPNADFSQIMPIERLMPNCSEGLARLIDTSMQYYLDDRFQSAAEFLKAVADIDKVDKRYKHLVLRQNLTAVGCILGAAVCSIIAILGWQQMGMEQAASYNVLIDRMEELRGEDGQEEQLEDLYMEAVAAFPEQADAYYQKAASLYENRDYEGLERFIEREVLDHTGSFSDEETAAFYFLLANACLELDDLDDALTYYRTAVRYNAHDSTYYSDYAIALARSGDLEKAWEILESAEEKGVSNDRILLARGEIASRQGNREEAAECFAHCIAETKDTYVMLRAYIMWGRLYDDTDEAGLLQKAAILTEGLEKVEDTDRAMVLEQLAQSYIDLGTLTMNNDYNMQAISCLQEIADRGWDSYVTHSNIGVLYQAVGNYELALQEFSDMLEFYGEDYRTYKRLAFLEARIQMAREKSDRDYSLFVDYYDKARQLFADSNVQADSDMEMQMLETAYEELEAGNWLP